MLFALSTSRDKWTKQLTGVACFVKDNTKRSYFIRVYDITVMGFGSVVLCEIIVKINR